MQNLLIHASLHYSHVLLQDRERVIERYYSLWQTFSGAIVHHDTRLLGRSAA